jgi:hypothetical protein
MKTLPKWTLIAITFILVSYACVLGYVAISTDRDVQFWPPRIGDVTRPNPLTNIVDLRADLTQISTMIGIELASKNAKVAEARTNMAAGGSAGGKSSYEWRQNIRDYEKDIYRIEDNIVSRMRALEKEMESLQKSCLDPDMADG